MSEKEIYIFGIGNYLSQCSTLFSSVVATKPPESLADLVTLLEKKVSSEVIFHCEKRTLPGGCTEGT